MGAIEINAYMLNNHYVFTDFNDLSSLIYDVLHHSIPVSQNVDHNFSIITGHVYWESMVFVNSGGKRIPLEYESEYDLYYSSLG